MLSDASLPAACRAFRAPEHTGDRRDADHRAACPACDAWAIHRDAVAAARGAERTLPAKLADRLRAIPRTVRDCPEAQDLVRTARAVANGRSEQPAVAAHLAGCAPCRSVVATLDTALVARRRPLPLALEERLRRLGRQRGFLWAFDLRAASVAAMLVGLLLVPVAEPTAAWARQAGNVVTEPIAQLRSTADQWHLPTPATDTLQVLTGPVQGLVDDLLPAARRKLSTYTASWGALARRGFGAFALLVSRPESVEDESRPRLGDHDDDRDGDHRARDDGNRK